MSITKKTNWQTKKLGEVLEYEQPSLYIVSSKNYKDDYETPVLTAGKSFILGKTKEKNGIFPKNKLPVIIFDDFTTATKFVDFPFKVKSSAMKILHPVKNISDAKFLFHLIQNISFDHTGIHKRYWISEYSKIEILLPPLPEQHRIVKILDEVFADVAKAKENAEKNLQHAKELFESYLQSVFLKPSKEWDEKKLGDKNLFQIIDGDRGKNYPKKSDFLNNGHCLFLNTKNVRPDGFDFRTTMFITEKKDNALGNGKLQRNDVLLTTRGTIGNIAVYDENVPFENIRINSGMLIFRPNITLIIPEYLFAIFQSGIMKTQIKKYVSGAAQPQLPIKTLVNFSIPVPKSLSEQKSIVAKLGALSAETRKLETIYQQKLANLEELKKSVLKRAFNGDL